jgi:hypothetical protein
MSAFEYVSSISFKIFIVGLVIYFIYSMIKNKQSGYLPIILLFLYYIYYFIMSRSYLEKFNDVSENDVSSFKENDVIMDTISKPFYDKAINSLDDYEYNMVFENETDRGLTEETRNKLMSQYPMDWTTHPPSSTRFNEGIEKEQSKKPQQLDTSMYANVENTNFTPPDLDSAEIKERTALKTYVPKGPSDMNTYNVDDAYTLIKNIYEAKGLEPEIEHKKDTNIYEIIGTRNTNEKIEYEDDLRDSVASEEAVTNQNESTTVVPQATRDYLYDSDPFYNTANRTRTGRNDYTQWTPGLERQFAPTYSTSQWY